MPGFVDGCGNVATIFYQTSGVLSDVQGPGNDVRTPNSITVDQPGVYTITVEDPNNVLCDSVRTVEVILAEVILVQIDTAAQDCSGSRILTATVTNSDPSLTYTYQWYEASSADGSDMLKLLGETNLTYTVSADMLGKFVGFEVTPVSATGGEDYLIGEPAMSAFVVVNGVGIETASVGLVDAYPNPFGDVLTLKNCASFETIAVIDITGREQQRVETLGESSVELNMEGFQNGVYFLRLTGAEGHSEILRVVKAQ